MSENYPWIIWELSSESYEWELSSENYHLIYHRAEKLRFIGIQAYPKIIFPSICLTSIFCFIITAENW